MTSAERRVYQALGGLLGAARRELGLTQQVVASRIDQSRASISTIEAGRQAVTVDQLLRYCAGLNLSAASIVQDLEDAVRKASDVSVEGELGADLDSWIGDILDEARSQSKDQRE